MNSTIIAAIISAIAIIIAAVIGLLKFRPKSEEPKKSDGNEFVPIEIEREKEDKKQNKVHDISAFNRLQRFIDSNWIQNFKNNQLAHPQYVQVAVTDDLHSYLNESEKPENEFLNKHLSEEHIGFIKEIKAFISAALQETTLVRPESKTAVVNAKAEAYKKWSKDYDKNYDREVKIIAKKAEGIIHAYKRYVQVARNESVYLQNN